MAAALVANETERALAVARRSHELLRGSPRVATAGAPVAVTTWGDPDRCEARFVITVMGALLPPPPPGAGGPFALAAPGVLEAFVERGHLSAEGAFDVPTPFVYGALAAAVRAKPVVRSRPGGDRIP